MYPGYRFMDLHPQQRDQVSYAPHYGPGFEPVSPQIKMDPQPYPLPYHGCYHHSYFPDYHGYGPHYPHSAPPAPVYTHGRYPPHPGYPFQYPPPLHYPVADPWYEYDKKGVGDHHCCGCPNHLWQQKENKNVKIEEHTSDDEKDRVALSGPSELKDSSYPVLWIPPGYKWNEEEKKKSESKEEEKKGCDKEVNERLKSFAQEPDFWNGWLPINLNNLNSLIKEGDKKVTERQQNEDKKILPPVGWMPYKSEQEEKSERKDGDQKFIWDPSQFRMFPLKFLENQDKKGIPMVDKGNHEHSSLEKSPKTGDKNVVQKIVPVKHMDQTEVKGLSKYGPKTGDKKFVQKIIPVQQMDRTEEKGISKNFENPIPVKPMDQTEEESISKVEKKTSNEPLKRTDKKGDGKHLDNNRNGQSSTSKASKLPPVCLRVDPLPSRRNKSGCSRSLSPPASRRKSEEVSLKKSSLSSTGQGNKQQDMQCSVDDNTVQNIKSEDWKKVPSQSLNNVSVSEDCKEVPPQSPVTVTAGEDQKEVPSHSPVDVSTGESLHKVLTSCQSGKGDHDCTVGDNGVINVDKSSGEVTKDEKLTSKDGEVTKAGDSTSETGSNGGPINTTESSVQCTNGAPNHRFSEAEAAVIIQSAYRGFEVRRWEPLKKLKEIAKIKGELIKIKEDVQKLVSSGSTSTDKQRIVIGETIMNLLLQLDTMQGLHPSVRNIRKSVAKELVSLQEELDALIIQNSEELKESEKSKHAEKIPKSAGVESGEHAGGNRHEQEISSTSHVMSDRVEPILGQPLTVTDVKISSVDANDSELMCAELPDPSDYVDSNKQHLEPLTEVDGPSEMHGLHKDDDSLQVDSQELPPSAVAEGNLNSAVQLQNISSLVQSDQTTEDDFGEVNIDMPSGASKQDSEAQVPWDGLQDDGGECAVGPGDLVLRGNEAKETIAEEQWQEKMMQKDNNDADQKDDTDAEGYSKILVNDAKETSTEEQQLENLLTESLHVSGLKDDIAATEGYLEGSSEPKDDISAGDSERDEKLSGEAMVELENVEASKAKDDGDIKDVVNACEVETDDQQTNNMQGTDTLLLEKNEMSDVNEVGNDVKVVDDMQPVHTFRPEANDILVATTDSEVKQPTVCTITKQEESPMEEIANCNMAQKMVVDEVWEDKFDNQEISHGHCNDSTVDLPIQVETLGEELVSKQPHQEFPASSPISGQISSCTGTESDQNLAVKNNNSSGTKTDSDQKKLALENKISSDTETDQKLAMENEKLRETVEKLIAAGKEQLTAISSLSGRVKDLEKKLSRKKKLKMRKHKPSVGQYLDV